MAGPPAHGLAYRCAPRFISPCCASMSTFPPTLGRTPSIDQQKGPVAARRHIPIQPLHIPAPASATDTAPSSDSISTNVTTNNQSAAAGSTSPAIVPIPYNADSSAVPTLPIDLGSVPVTYPRSAEQRMDHEGGVLASAAEDLRVFAQPVTFNQPGSYAATTQTAASH